MTFRHMQRLIGAVEALRAEIRAFGIAAQQLDRCCANVIISVAAEFTSRRQNLSSNRHNHKGAVTDSAFEAAGVLG